MDAPPPQPPNPGQASVPNQPPPVQGQAPQPMQMPPASQGQVPVIPQPPQATPQPAMAGPPQVAQPPQQQPIQIPPYVSPSNMKVPPPAMPPQQSQGMVPPAMQDPNNQRTVQQAQQMVMPDEQFKSIFRPELTRTEKELGAYKKAYPNASGAAIMKMMGFDSAKALRDQINEEQKLIEKNQHERADFYDKSLNRDETHAKNSAEIRRWDAETNQGQQRIGLEAKRVGIEGARLGLARNADARAAAQQISATSGYDKLPDNKKKEIDYYAEKSMNGDDSWKVGLSRGKYGQALMAQVNERIPVMAAEKGLSSGDTTANKSVLKANSMALNQITKDVAAMRPYKDMLDKNIEVAIDLGKKVSKTNSAAANKSINWIKSNMTDSPDAKEYMGQIAIVQTEAARVLNNPRLVGQLTDSARHEMQEIVDGNTPIKATERVLKRLKQDGDNRLDAMVKEGNLLKNSIVGVDNKTSSKKSVHWDDLK